MHCGNCGGYIDPVGGPYPRCPYCGHTFSIADMMGETGQINTSYGEAKRDWRDWVAREAKSSGLPHWQCKSCKRVYADVSKPRHGVCQECRTGKPHTSS